MHRLGTRSLYAKPSPTFSRQRGNGSGTNGYEQAYLYSYDDLDRYTLADYYERSGSGSFVHSQGWNEAVTGYDENGNIKSLTRNAATAGVTGSAIDNLTYTYKTNNANQLDQVTDATGVQTGFGIYAGGSSSGHYGYDNNGNLTSDPFKNIGTTFNVLNKTDVITMNAVAGQNIAYIYDASGSMIRKIATAATGGAVTTTDYIDGFVYVNSTLSYFPMPEGRMVNEGGKLKPQYVITDQQGNARITLDDSGAGHTAKVLQENSYYGFGMVMPGSAVGLPTPPNKNLYNGQSEIQNDFNNLPDLMQTFFRNYDAALGRWIGVDPQAESAESMSVYQYAGNNPIMGNDPLGNFWNVNTPVDQSRTDNPFYWQDRIAAEAQGNYQDPENYSNQNGGSIKKHGLDADYSAWFQNAVANIDLSVDSHFSGAELRDLYDSQMGITLPSINIRDLESGNLPSWWGNSQLFLDGGNGGILNSIFKINHSLFHVDPGNSGPGPNPYEFNSANVDKFWGNVAWGLSMVVGGEFFGGAKLLSVTARGAALKGGISFLSQASANGLSNVDYADVGFDAFTSPYASAFLGAEFDFQPFRVQGNIFGVGGIYGGKSINQVGFETGANFLFGGIAEHGGNIYGNYFLNTAGKAGTNAAVDQIFK